MSAIYSLLRQAIIERKQVILAYAGYEREVCPHVLGLKQGRQHVLTFQFGGGSASGLPPGGQWRCMDVGKIRTATMRDGPWHTGLSHTQPQSCVDQIDVQISLAPPATPYAKRA